MPNEWEDRQLEPPRWKTSAAYVLGTVIVVCLAVNLIRGFMGLGWNW